MNRRDLIKSLGAVTVAALCTAFILAATPARALILPGGSASAARDLILNLGQLSYFDTELMFLNVLKQASNADGNAAEGDSPWQTFSSGGTDTGEEAYLSQILDTNGYPTTLALITPPSGGQQFVKLKIATLGALPMPPGASTPYPSGNYRFGFQGKETGIVGGDFTVAAQTLPAGVTVNGLSGAISAQGANAVIQSTNAWGTTNYVTLTAATPSTAGFTFTITALPDSGNYMKAMTLVQSSLAASLDAGNVFHPAFLSLLQSEPWKALRFMDTLNTNGQVQHARYLGYMFSSAPTAGQPLPALSAPWPQKSGQRRITLATGEELLATFTTGSTTVTSTANPTVTATTSSVPAGEVTTDFFWFAYDSWSERPQLSDLSYATAKGVPYEIPLLLCQILGTDPWLNIPPQLQSADWASFASLVTANLAVGHKAIPEISNEVWNAGAFTAYHWMQCKSEFLWGTSDWASYLGMLTTQMAAQLATVAGNPGFDNDFMVALAGQASNTAVITGELSAATWVAHGGVAPWTQDSASGQKLIKIAAIAPYAGQGPIWAADYTLMQSQADPTGTFLATFTAGVVGGNQYHDQNGANLPAGGWFAEASTWVTNTASALSSYGSLPIWCYEGSIQTDANGASGQATFLSNAMRDSRMEHLQWLYYQQIATAGAIPAQYNFSYPYATYQWGLIESVMQTVLPPRWVGALAYIQGLTVANDPQFDSIVHVRERQAA